ncbi:MAG: polysaccharide biosynthesis C-terminal domain-containing protein [Crocinitomicaceae bacterium]|nr:polysaccharide biosynthesis C-terminal domain-containing protein [Crocinitomicaceae bacterium]MBK8924356.1 polysaccharide biosynthesis C-terminal domain-containing protein [Crocinitomicaceae bacterium]
MSVQRQFLPGLFLIILLNLLVKPFFILGIDAEIQNRVGEEVYGNYFALLNFSFLFNILLDLGITNFNTRNIAQNPQLVAKHFGKILRIRIWLFFLYALISVAAGIISGFKSYEFQLLLILVFNQFLVAVIQFCRSNFGGLHLFKTDAFVSVLDRALLILFCIILLWSGWFEYDFNISWFIYAQTLAYAITAGVSLILMIKGTCLFDFKLKKSFSLVVLRNSLPYALLILLMMLYNRLDAVLLERLLPNGDYQAGIYAQGFRYLDAVNMFALLFAGVLLPVFARQLKSNGQVGDVLNLSLRLLMSAAIVVALVGFFFRSYLLDLRYENVSDKSITSFGFLILSFIPVSLTYIYGTLLTAAGKLKQLNFMAAGGLILNVIMNLILIPRYEAEGAAMVALVTQCLTALTQILIAHKVLNLKFELSVFVRFLLLAATLTGYVFFISPHINHVMLSCMLFLLLAVILVLAFRLVKPADLKELIRFK